MTFQLSYILWFNLFNIWYGIQSLYNSHSRDIMAHTCHPVLKGPPSITNLESDIFLLDSNEGDNWLWGRLFLRPRAIQLTTSYTFFFLSRAFKDHGSQTGSDKEWATWQLALILYKISTDIFKRLNQYLPKSIISQVMILNSLIYQDYFICCRYDILVHEIKPKI